MTRWAVLTGPKGSGKSGQAMQIAQRLRSRGLTVAGFVQTAWMDGLERKGYDLVRLGTEDRIELARPGSSESPGAFCSWVFDLGAFDVAQRWVRSDGMGADVILIDEVSKLEASGKGHHDALVWSLTQSGAKVVLVCARADQLFFVVERFGFEGDDAPYLEIPATPEDKDGFVEAMMACAR